MSTPSTVSWQDKVARKQLAVKAAIPVDWLLPSHVISSSNVLEVPRQSGILSQKELEITGAYSAGQLLKKLAAAELTASEVTLAFSKRAAIAQQVVSSILCLEKSNLLIE
jgi:amidase